MPCTQPSLFTDFTWADDTNFTISHIAGTGTLAVDSGNDQWTITPQGSGETVRLTPISPISVGDVKANMTASFHPCTSVNTDVYELISGSPVLKYSTSSVIDEVGANFDLAYVEYTWLSTEESYLGYWPIKFANFQFIESTPTPTPAPNFIIFPILP